MSTAPGVPLASPLVATLARHEAGRQWLRQLPGLVADYQARWRLRIGAPFTGGSCSWAAPVHREDGSTAVLKVTWPHPEAAGEAAAMRHWAGAGTVRLLEADERRYALLLERCEPGTALDAGPPPHGSRVAVERLRTGGALLAELWRVGGDAPGGVAELAAVCASWATLAEERADRLAARFAPRVDPGLSALGARLLRELPGSSGRHVLLHGDFNPGNVLAAERRPWLVIDPKPMVGDPAYDPWPLIEQMATDRPLGERFAVVADACGQPRDRLAAWALARTVEYAWWAADHGDAEECADALALLPVLARLADR
ncbi:phosphotransferase [Streptomyces sp. OF3]|uniref:Phosphotransferase n=1 Tax=Streptomyces alkaliterrae TaxID=2213162 RepID=A0A7W3WGE1_9ACTN|nr:aminoglycoside phosphotransferase family protein [Streptomyces alkaliterrae]MBB1251896.1 phosphotransferase [Streptomyces alkaliterrae]